MILILCLLRYDHIIESNVSEKNALNLIYPSYGCDRGSSGGGDHGD